MSGYYLKDINLVPGSTTTSVGFTLPAENRLVCSIYVNSGAAITRIEHSVDGTNWLSLPSSFALIALSNQVFGWNLSHTTAAVPPLPLIRIIGTGLTSIKIAAVG